MKPRLFSFVLSLMVVCTLHAAAQNTSPEQTERLLKSGDTLGVLVWQKAELSSRNLVITDGKINLPLLGPVQAEGLTPSEFRQIIQGRLANYVADPNVTVVLVAVASNTQGR